MKNTSRRALGIAGIVAAAGLALAPQAATAQITPRAEHKAIMLPDLVVEEMTFTRLGQIKTPDGAPTGCWNFAIHATILNQGTASTGQGSTAQLAHRSSETYWHSENGWGRAIPALAAGASYELPPFTGLCTCYADAQGNLVPDPMTIFRIYADINGEIKESNDKNNSKQGSLKPNMSSATH